MLPQHCLNTPSTVVPIPMASDTITKPLKENMTYKLHDFLRVMYHPMEDGPKLEHGLMNEGKYLRGNYKIRSDVIIQVKNPTSPFYEDPSGVCESIIKVSQSTQTPPSNPLINVETNKRKCTDYAAAKRVRTEETALDDETFLQLCSRFLSPNLAKLVKLNFNTTNGQHNVNFTLFSLNLYYSSNLYNLLRGMLSLKSRDALKYFLLPKTTRISEHFINSFRCKINNMSSKERICSFSVGSVLLKPNLYYDIRFDRIIGVHDINGIQNICIAKYAVLLMVQGILKNWRQPIAYAFISEYDNFPEISIWIDEVLTLLLDIGLDIRAFVSDPSSEFLYASESRYVTPSNPAFTVNGTEIFYFYDSSQLLKIVKNNLKSCDFYYKHNLQINKNTEFFNKVNNLCDLLNAKYRCSSSRYRSAFANKIYQKNLLHHMMELFQNLKVVRKSDGVDVTDNMRFIKCFQVTINSVIQLFEELNFINVKYLLTCRLSHIWLTRFFAHLQQDSGKHGCTPRRFNRCFVRSFVFNMLKKPSCANNVEDSLDSEEFSQQLLEEESQEVESNSNQPLLVHTTDYRDNLPDKNAFVYICGYCYLKCMKVHCCDTFRLYLNASQRKQERDEKTFLCSVSLGTNIQNCNMLPPADFIQFLMMLETKFKEYFTENIHICNVGQEILKAIEHCGFGMPCPCFPIEYLKTLFVRIRLYYTIRKNNSLLKRRRGMKTMKVFSL